MERERDHWLDLLGGGLCNVSWQWYVSIFHNEPNHIFLYIPLKTPVVTSHWRDYFEAQIQHGTAQILCNFIQNYHHHFAETNLSFITDNEYSQISLKTHHHYTEKNVSLYRYITDNVLVTIRVA